MKLRHLMIAMLLLTVAGCGCNEDSTTILTRPVVPACVFEIGTSSSPFAVEPTAGSPVIPIDVFLVMDDSFSMENLAPTPPTPTTATDQRKRTQIAQRVFAKLQDQVKAQLIARILATPSLAAKVDVTKLDFAFGVGRFEDFGGQNWRDATGGDQAGQNDAAARPFTLNMPLLRELHPDFPTRFETALQRTKPGNGNPSIATPDPQSGVEALYQIAAGPGNPEALTNGFDGDNDGSTLGDGQPCSATVQDSPGASGDVPAVQYGPAGPEPAGGDPDRPQYTVRDETGADGPCVSSGNIGGVGWREDSARFVILASDIATVAPLATIDPDLSGIGAPPYMDPTPFGVRTTSVNGDPVPAGWRPNPREASSIPTVGFRGARNSPETSRFGLAGATSVGAAPATRLVAPVGAHTVQETVDALNALGIEVICLATPTIIPNDTKPGIGGSTAIINGEPLSDVDDVLDFEPTITPWTWLTAMTRLTGGVSTVETRTEPPSSDPKRADPDDQHLGLVYNMSTLWPFNPADPDGSLSEAAGDADVDLNMVDGLVDRIADWLENDYLVEVGGSGSTPDPLPNLVYDLTLTIPLSTTNGLVTRAAPGGTTFTTQVEIPAYYTTGTPPGAVVTFFPTASQFTYDRNDPNDPLPQTGTLNATITATFVKAVDATSGTDVTLNPADPAHAQLLAQIASRALLPAQADADLDLEVRDSTVASATAVIGTYNSGCVLLIDQAPTSPVQGTTQQAGTCPFP